MGQQYGAAQPLIDLVNSAANKAYDWANLGPIKRAASSAYDKMRGTKDKTKPIATTWAYYGKPQPRPSSQKQTPRKAAPKKISGRKN
jgi:hypothetical protein